MDIVEAIASIPLRREVRHCGETFQVEPFAIYTTCPVCETRLKIRSFSANTEIEDVFDAVMTWMNQPGAREVVQRRHREIAADSE